MAEHARPTVDAPASTVRSRVRAWFPHGRALSEERWRARHRGVLALLWLHVPALFALGLFLGQPARHMLLEVGLLAGLALAALPGLLPRRWSAVAACLGLVTASGMTVHVSGGYIEAHFHYFVMLGVIALYHDWLPYAVSIVYVVVHHGTMGIVDPAGVYNHAAAFAHPWRWAGIHAGFVAALSVANVVSWRAAEAANGERDRALREQAQALSTLGATLDSTADGLLVIDRAWRMVHHNQRFLDIWGLDADIVESGDTERALAAVLERVEEPEAFVRRVRELQHDDAQESFDTLRFRDGRTIERYSRPLRIDGHPEGRVWSFRDVTERERAQAERAENLARARELHHLRELDEFRTRFINTAAHELNTPLTPMRIQFHLLSSGSAGALSDGQRRSLEVLQRSFERFDRLVQDLLQSARLQADGIGVERRPLELGELVEQAVAAFAPGASAHRIQMDARVEGPLDVEGDPIRLLQVLDNLLGNALKFTSPGGRIHVEARAARGQALVRVTDSGAGLTPEQIARLFLPFSQVHEPARTREGSGLGLYICKGLVELHGGRIWCESQGPGCGSAFAFVLPLRPAAVAATHPAA